MNSTVNIRFASLADAETLADIGAKSFFDAFAHDERNKPEDMRVYMDENFTVEATRKDLADKNVVIFIAEIEDKVVGYAKLQKNSAEKCVKAKNPVELCRLYVLQKFIGKGIGAKLMNACLDFAREKNSDFIWLGVWEFNFRAQKFYAKFGFEKCGEHIFQLGSDSQIDWVLQKRL